MVSKRQHLTDIYASIFMQNILYLTQNSSTPTSTSPSPIVLSWSYRNHITAVDINPTTLLPLISANSFATVDLSQTYLSSLSLSLSLSFITFFIFIFLFNNNFFIILDVFGLEFVYYIFVW